MNWLVIDSHVAAAWLLPAERSAAAERVLVSALAGDVDLVVPHLWSCEMLQVILEARREGRFGADQAAEALRLLEAVPRRGLDHDTAMARDRALRLAGRFDLSASEATYLEVADRLQCPLLSFSPTLNRAAAAIDLASSGAG